LKEESLLDCLLWRNKSVRGRMKVRPKAIYRGEREREREREVEVIYSVYHS
jgi:hypothetical protein